MRRVKTLTTWYLLLNKRLMKKYSFLLILCMVPCLVLGFRLASGGENHILRIALYAPEDDVAGQQVLRDLMEEDSIIGYVVGRTPEEAEALFYHGKADAAWIFEEALDDTLEQAAAEKIGGKMVRVLQREDSMQMRLARVKLYTGVYPYYVYKVYEEFVRGELGGAEECSDEELRAYFDATFVEDSIFDMRYMDVEEKVEEESNYLLSPLRGILALWLVLVGLASAMYFMRDEKEGLFAWIPVRHRYLLACGYHLVAVSDAAAVMLLAQFLTGNFVSLKRELVSMLLFAMMVVGFCSLLQIVFHSVERLGSLIPILMIGMLVLCPVFLNVRKLHFLQCLLPPYHYLRSMHDSRTLVSMAVYAAAAFVLGFLAFRIGTMRKS